nr:autotransporter serine protease [Pantoea sp. 1.19]
MTALIARAEPPTGQGHSGDAASWRGNEFDKNWGLSAIHADSAYAAGYTGRGQIIGILDYPVAPHPEFAGPNKLHQLITQGYRAIGDKYRPNINAGDPFYFDGTLHFYDNNGLLGDHGVHVAGIAAANRDGVGTHGVAFDAQIMSADNDNDGPGHGEFLALDGAVTQAAWQALVNSGTRIINNSWGISIADELSRNGSKWNLPHFTLKEAQQQYDQIKPLLGSLDGAGFQGALDAARQGILMIFAAGNDANFNHPDAMSGLAYFTPDVVPRWLTVANVRRLVNREASKSYAISLGSSRCGYAASFCVSAPGTGIYNATVIGTEPKQLQTGYVLKSGTSMAAPHVAGAAALLMQRFPYLDVAHIADILKTTAVDLGDPGIDPLYGWGMIDLDKAMRGPGMFITEDDIPAALRVPDPSQTAYGSGQFIADIPGAGAVLDAGTRYARRCDDIHCQQEVYSNDIGGHGGLSKRGAGTLLLTGNNTWRGITQVLDGLLVVDGSVASAVTVKRRGIVGGSGRVGSLDAAAGGTVAPGHSVGTLRVNGDVNFQPGSRLAVEVAADGRSDRLESDGAANLDGGEVAVLAESGGNLLSQREVYSLRGERYTLLRARRGISGQFERVTPNYLFLGAALGYQPETVTLRIGRNDTAFVSVAQTPNQQAVAQAADGLPAGHPVYESLLLSESAQAAQQAFSQLSGQLHADMASALLNDGRHLRDALNGRLRQVAGLVDSPERRSDEGGAWGQLLGTWGHGDGADGEEGYRSSTRGVVLGWDAALKSGAWLGVSTGFTRTGLHGLAGAQADSHNVQLAAYGGVRSGALGLRAGVSHAWHRIETSRTVSYGAQRDRETSKYNAGSTQAFAEAGYALEDEWATLEPFINLSAATLALGGMKEAGGAAALGADRQHLSAAASTLGVRADRRWLLGRHSTLGSRLELGWQRSLGAREREVGLYFTDVRQAFAVGSARASRDGLVVKADVALNVDARTTLSLGYGGLLSASHRDNSVYAGFNWAF